MTYLRHILLLLVPCLLLACAKPSTQTVAQVKHPAFSSDTACWFIAHQLHYGARVPGTKPHQDCLLFLVNMLHNYGAEVEIQQGTLPNYEGKDQPIYNIIGRFGSLTADHRLLLCAHYDSRPWADEEADYDQRFLPVPGANDGASGVGVLLEVARQLSKDTAFSRPVDIVFFDCEDMGTPSFYTGPARDDTWCLGSQLWARRTVAAGHHRDYQYGILLDMVGAPDAVFPREYYSVQYASSYVDAVWSKAATLGFGERFSSQQSYPILDDHYYVNTLTGIPCIDIIHYDMSRETGFPYWWHTVGDDMSHIDPATIQSVGEVIMAVIK